MGVTFTTFSQDYRAMGFRFGGVTGFNYRTFLNEEVAAELIFGRNNKGLNFTGLFKFQEAASMVYSDRFFINYGFGAHVGYYNEDEAFKSFNDQGELVVDIRKVTRPRIGFDACAGFEYHLESFPLILGIDYKPFFNLYGPFLSHGIGLFDFGWTILYKF